MYAKGQKHQMGLKFFACLFAILFLSTVSFAQELAIPRFVSFRHGDINLRTGPGSRYPIKFVYRVKNYPVEIIDEYELWRQIREIDGTIGWVHRRMLSGVRYILVTEEAALHKKENEKSPIIAHVQKNVLGKIKECPKQSNLCLVEFTFQDDTYKGWMNKNSFYGVYPHEIIQ